MTVEAVGIVVALPMGVGDLPVYRLADDTSTIDTMVVDLTSRFSWQSSHEVRPGSIGPFMLGI